MKHRIIYIFRKPSLFFSIETIFHGIAGLLSQRHGVELEEKILPYSGLNLSAIWRNAKMVSTLKADVFHVTGDIHYITLFLPGSKTLLTIHDCVFMYRSSGLKRKMLQYLLLQWPVQHCRLITTISEKTKQDILRFTHCPEEKIRVIPNPVNEKMIYEAKEFDAQKPVVLFIGSTPNKNLLRVAEALNGISCTLDIVGEIPPGEKEQLDKNNIEYRQFLDLPENEMIMRYQQADMVLFPSTFEGFGMPIIEAQKTGRPVVTSNISPMKEVAGDAACLIDPFSSDSIREGVNHILHDPAYRQQLVSRGLENVKRYDPEIIASEYDQLYNDIINKK